MPELIWDSKSLPEPNPASFAVDSIIYPGGNGYPHGEPANQLFFGDNLEVMSALLPEYENRINLIYADPPWRFYNFSAKGEGRNATEFICHRDEPDVRTVGC